VGMVRQKSRAIHSFAALMMDPVLEPITISLTKWFPIVFLYRFYVVNH
jgi:hypothetical protein